MTTTSLSSIGGKKVFHVVGLGTYGKSAFAARANDWRWLRPKRLPPSIVGMEACLSAHFVSRALHQLGRHPRIIPAIYVEPFVKRQKERLQ
jgi:transposase